MDEHDRALREGVGILVLLIMKYYPEGFDGGWSQVLKLVSKSDNVAAAVVDFILRPYTKKDLLEETRAFLQ